MPRKDTPRLGMAYGWLRGEDWWGDPTSMNRVVTDALLHPAPLSMTLSEPPAGAAEGDQYLVPAGAIGEWTGRDHALATFVEGRWLFVPPFEGLRVRVRDFAFVWFNGEEWEPEEISAIPDPAQGTRYDIGISVGYAPEPGETLLVLPIAQNMILPAGAAGSRATTIAPPSAAVQLAIYRNSAQIGTVTFSASGFSGILTVPANTNFLAGDRLRVACPLSLPSNFKEFGIVLRMSLL